MDKSKYMCIVLGICAGLTPSPSNSFEQTQKPTNNEPLRDQLGWSLLEFDYESDNTIEKQADISSGFYNPIIPAPIDVDVFYGNTTTRVFLTIPRWQIGSPVTLGVVTDKKENGNRVIAPFPSWSWNRNPESCNPNRLISVYRIKIDECGRLWVLDTGKYGSTQTCPPQILAFDPRTGEVLHRYEIPATHLEPRSILVTPVVDVRDAYCADTFLYIADCQTYSIIVYDVNRRTSWHVTDKTMYPNPDYGTYKIQGDEFELMDGVLGMDLEPYVNGRDRKLFFHAMSSNSETWVYTSLLRNETRFKDDPTSSPEIFKTFPSRRPTQSCALAIDRRGIAYFGLMADITVNCWHTASSDYGKYIDTIGKDTVRYQFVSGAKIINNKYGEQELWILTSRFQKVITGRLQASEKNFRIMAGRTINITNGKQCVYPGGAGSSNRGGGYGFTAGYQGLHDDKLIF